MDVNEQRLPNQPSDFARLVFFEPEKAAAKLAPMLSAGMTAPAIAEKFAVNESTVRRWVYRLRESEHLAEGFKLGPRTTKKVSAKKLAEASPGDAKAIEAAREQGSQAEAARKLGVSRQRVNAAFSRARRKK